MLGHKWFAGKIYRPFQALIWHGDKKQNRIYLTFDDGPYPPLTFGILEILNHSNIPATFFLSGENIVRYRHQLQGIDYTGHILGNHFYYHIPVFGISGRGVKRQLEITDRLIKKYFHEEARALRPPFGIFGYRLLRELRENGKQLILWSVMANDFKWEAEKVLTHLKKNVASGDIIVFHDNPKSEKVILQVLWEFTEFCKGRFEFGKWFNQENQTSV